MRYIRGGIYILLMLASSTKADQFCFALAETYYEQVYCQLQAKAQTKGLPSFNQFKKNNETVQASLLRRPAERNAIKLPLPARTITPAIAPITSPEIVNKPQTVRSEAAVSEPNSGAVRNIHSASTAVVGCELTAKQIRCDDRVFKLVGNKANHRLAADALTGDNKMALPAYQGGELQQYLTRAYTQYITKMCDIGLCGVTMTYGKFAYLYQDLQSKGLDFPQRFEIMYGFLKKDKATMGVSESSSVPASLSLQACAELGDTRFVCDHQGRNYIFDLQ